MAGGTASDYEQWAGSVPGVHSVTVRKWDELGEVVVDVLVKAHNWRRFGLHAKVVAAMESNCPIAATVTVRVRTVASWYHWRWFRWHFDKWRANRKITHIFRGNA